MAPPTAAAEVSVDRGHAGRAALRVRAGGPHRAAGRPAVAALRHRARRQSDADALIAAAAEAAAAADVALVVVGTNSRVESEGYDRTSLALPGRQDDLVRAVAAANPRTVVL